MTTDTAPRKQPRPEKARQSAWKGWLPNLGVAAIVLFCLLPFYWMVATTLRPPSQQFDNSPIPRAVSMDNLIAVFDPSVGFHRALLNSFFVAGTTTVLTLIIGTTTAYALARLSFRGKNLVLVAIIATVMFPGISLIIPLLKLFTNIGWINTYQAMIVPYLSFALPLTVWLLTTFFKQMPFELEQAAQVDGCTPGQAFRKVILPVALPGMFTAAILTFIMAWNEFIIALTMVNRPEMKTVTVAISQFTGAQGFQQPFGTQMAAGVVVTVPLVILVLVCQRRIVAGLTAGGVK